jgi:ABC-2 type transport system permease protein
MLASELRLLFGRARTRALLGALASVPVLVAVAVRLSGGPGGGDGPPFVSQITDNGVFAALGGLTVVLPLFMPLAVSMVAGDTIAGEAGYGTLRSLLVRPVGRTKLLATKFTSAGVFCVAAAAAVALAGLLAGAILFPLGRVTTLSGTTVSLAEGIGRVLAAAGVVGVFMLGLAAVGLFISTLTESAMGAMAATTAVAVASQVLDSIPQLDAIHPLLLTHDWFAFGDLLRGTPGLDGIAEGMLVQAGWIIVFGLAAWARFTTKDVLA